MTEKVRAVLFRNRNSGSDLAPIAGKFAVSRTARKTSAAVLEWVRPPHQARTRAALERFLDAGESLFLERAFDEVAVTEIVERADASVGAFYRRFRDKDGLLQAVHERFCEQARATADDALAPARWADATIDEMASAFITFLVEIFRERAGLIRVFAVQGQRDRVVRERTETLYDHLSEKLAFVLRSHGVSARRADGIFGARFALVMVLGFLTEVVLLQQTKFSLEDPRVAESLAQAFLGYVQSAPEAPGAS